MEDIFIEFAEKFCTVKVIDKNAVWWRVRLWKVKIVRIVELYIH
jgi:hypothetical protein